MDPRLSAAPNRFGTRGEMRQTVSQQEWRSWSSVRATIPNLPRGTTTYDIHKNLQRFGRLEYIRIEETPQGDFARKAHVTFKPPPPRRAPWDPVYKFGIDFPLSSQDGERVYKVKVWLSLNQLKAQVVESHVHAGLEYPAEMTLFGTSIDFGYLQTPTLMVVKASKFDVHANAIRLVLNLKRLELEVHFPVMIRSKGKTTERAYRFFVALDDQFSLHEVPNGQTSSLVIHAKHPPCYSRQLKEAMQLSHDPKSFKWTADDTWSRQTDIVDEKSTFQKIDSSPVSVQKLYNSIDIARWTTFRVTVKPSTNQSDNSLKQFLKALADFNIRITQDPSFEVVKDSSGGAPLWRMLGDTSSHQSLSAQLSLPYVDFDLRYQLEVCISKGWLNEYTLDDNFLRRLTGMRPEQAKQMLIHVDSYQQRVYDPMSIFTDLRYSKPVRARALPSNCAELYHATVTATRILFHTPSVEITNRIVRKYRRFSDRFLRVRFEDDPYRGQTRLYPATNGRMKLLFERVRRTLKRGIVLGDRHYEFLAWGNSQLREHGAYFFASSKNPLITADSIRRDMGTFDHEKVVAKRAARMGQCFSTTKPVLVLSRNSWKRDLIPDIVNGPYYFTDGVGKISPLAAQLVKTNLKLGGEHLPSAYQFRLSGCKGVLAVDPSLNGVDIKIRPSQYKFSCESDELEIIRVSEFWQPFLNRQLIQVLSALGVPDAVFLHKQRDCIEALDAALVDDTAALRALRETVDPNLITLSVAALIEAGFSQIHEPFVASLLRLWRAWTLKYLKEKAKIPIAQGAFVLGVVDETRTLRGHINDIQPSPDASRQEKEKSLPEIFIQYTDPELKGVRRIVEGICVIARNPSLHRGDVRVVKAVNVPQLHHHCDVVVMPATGDRDLPSMCSGGDLDGDDYIVTWDPDLIPSEWNAEPFHYNAPEPIQKEEISIDDIIDFFCDYMQNDFLGRIAHAHLAAADYLADGIRSEQCLKLVELHSVAVDYPKTGVPAEMSRDLERNNWPHFMEKKRNEYRSKKILGQLYDAVERVKFKPHWSGTFDPRILTHAPAHEIMETVSNLKKSYDERMRRIMAQHQIGSEFEVWSTFVLHHSKVSKDFKFHEEIGQHAKNLKEQYYEAFCQEAGGHDSEKLKPFAIAAYHITHDELREAQAKQQNLMEDEAQFATSDESGSASTKMPFISFPWVLQDTLVKIARNTVMHDAAPIVEQMSTASEEVIKVGTVLASEGISREGIYHGEHLPDPYSPVATSSGAAGIEMTAATVKKISSPEPEMAPPPCRQESLEKIRPIRPQSIDIFGNAEDHFASDISSLVSSNVPSVVSSNVTTSTNSDDIDLLASPTHLSSEISTPSSPISGSHVTARFQSPMVSTSSKGPSFVVHEKLPLKDPVLMTNEEFRDFEGDSGDEDDYTF
ncbi:uncharacterized protein Z519_02881 [Cladophialophora bantiana CBS 173.52]|uniref:RNA-dependent RNA polymerase n=1 Tax=Cladophialophora bantiana (strain ATCC 10958 / CBS 173.52 / CDC B-1940 / NIH 8579) TaxID=1442370 RepID=A0A0D2GB58_CLAB1|nr:uncharacterized protein Z519_02881 [Cladophialophora bantiana CBS 173.52]KIW95817.1 hypothetical protein Z519_02881 [Cladophialophora bantiana CBS 173.52]